MDVQGKNILRITGILEIVVGVFSIILITFVLNGSIGDVEVAGIGIAKDDTFSIILTYLSASIQIVVGLLGIIFANKASMYNVNVYGGYALLGLSLLSFFLGSNGLSSNIIAFALPILYIYGAMLNKKSIEQ